MKPLDILRCQRVPISVQTTVRVRYGLISNVELSCKEKQKTAVTGSATTLVQSVGTDPKHVLKLYLQKTYDWQDKYNY